MDLHTLHVEHAVLLSLLMLLTIFNLRMHRNAAGLNWFAAFCSSICAGAILIALRIRGPESFFIFFGNMLFSIGYFCLHCSMTRFFGAGFRQWRIQAGLLILNFISQIEFSLLRPDTTNRLIALSCILGSQVAMTAVFVFRRTPVFMRAAGWLMGVLLAMLCLGNFVRLIALLLYATPQNYLAGGPVLAWTVLNTTVLQCGVLIAFVWMTAARLHHDLEVQALTDPLTGLLNRRGIELFATRVITLSQRSQLPVSAILFDLDEFKRVNDSYGHLCGDTLLVAIARCIQDHSRHGELLARLGGDEFFILLEDTALEIANAIAQRMRAAIEELRVEFDRHQVFATASFGVAQLADASDDWKELLQHCDRALYEVKKGGGNLVGGER